MSLPTSPNSPAVMSQAAKDAQFLLELFRESPTPIHINIGPYSAKTGAKPNTIIKRLAGIKSRNRLNIKTTQGDYKPSGTGISPRPAKAPKLKSPKLKDEPSSPVSIDTRPIPQPNFKWEPPQPVAEEGSYNVKPEPPQCPLTPVSSRTQSMYGDNDGGPSGGTPVSSTAVPEQEQPQMAGVKRWRREWDQEFLL